MLGAVAPIAGQLGCLAGVASTIGAIPLATAAHATTATSAVQYAATEVGTYLRDEQTSAIEEAERKQDWVITDHDRDTAELIRRGIAEREAAANYAAHAAAAAREPNAPFFPDALTPEVFEEACDTGGASSSNAAWV